MKTIISKFIWIFTSENIPDNKYLDLVKYFDENKTKLEKKILEKVLY
jgi:hypothetical protein